MSELLSMIFVEGLTSFTETDRVFLTGEPVKSSFDLVERTTYAKVSSRHPVVARVEHKLH